MLVTSSDIVIIYWLHILSNSFSICNNPAGFLYCVFGDTLTKCIVYYGH
jgi:hypothetical protein